MKKLTNFKFQSVMCKMLSIIFLSVCIIFSICVYHSFADVPCMINYQGRLIENNVPVSGPKTMVFSIYDSLGTELWTSGEKPIQVHNGLFRHVLGEGFIGGSSVADLSSIDWTAGEELYLEVTVDEETLSPREPIYAYPYAINTHLLEGKTTDYFLNRSGEEQIKRGNLIIEGGTLDINAPGTDIDALRVHSGDTYGLYVSTSGKVGIGTTSPGAKLHVGGIPGTDGIMFPDGTLQTTAGGGQRSQVVGTTNIGPPGANYVDMTDMSITMETKGGDVLLLFSASVDVSNADGATAWIHFTVGGIKKQEMHWHNYHTRQTIASMHWLAMGLPAGSHTFKVRWKGTYIQQYGATYPRVFTAIEY